MTTILPEIGVVIIGVNVGEYIGDCIRSVRAADYPQELITITYVDGGSMDNSCREASAAGKIHLIELNDVHPTPGRGRNAGWKSMSTPLIQFLDADTILAPGWFKAGLAALDEKTAAVCGRRKERYPDKNIFHRLTEMEWRYELGVCRYFGGDVLIKRDILERTNGFDEALVAGEDPELSYRIRETGQRILRIDASMTTHDINMSSLRQYWKRALRSGYAYAEIGLRFMDKNEKMWLRELVRICVAALLPPGGLIMGIAAGYPKTACFFACLIFLKPFFKLGKISSAYGRSLSMSLLYASHAAVVVYPQFYGVMRYLIGRIFNRPLQNKGIVNSQGETVHAG